MTERGAVGLGSVVAPWEGPRHFRCGGAIERGALDVTEVQTARLQGAAVALTTLTG